MEKYSLLREIADSWMLLAMLIFFLGTWVWAFRPGSRDTHRDASQIPFRHETAPDADDCDKQCDTCNCRAVPDFLKEA
ncbi:cbb3-type cytochrome c oxidase subunit 3 [Rhodobacteraceae bacterium CCMM004]|nr:cbb3-type cytochrome c oxidase subunit 3 [Rhodobacteraceae bacterium CCMM004]